MSAVAFATYQASPEMTGDDRLVADVLRRNGVAVASAVWDAPEIDWSRFDGVVIRSTWDYHLKPEQYEQWLQSFRADGPRLWNPPHAVLENLNKRYLIALAREGVEVVPTSYQAAAEGVELRDVLERCPWEEVVIKPAVSASAYGTWRTSRAATDADRSRFREQVRRQDILLQPYVPEIASQGEWSMVFFGGRYNHAVLKRPAAGDFRVQEHLGGNAVPASPAPRLIEQAQAVLAAVEHPLLYARVDGVERAGRFVLMELEINEPYLFVGFAEGAAERFAEAILAVLQPFVRA